MNHEYQIAFVQSMASIEAASMSVADAADMFDCFDGVMNGGLSDDQLRAVEHAEFMERLGF